MCECALFLAPCSSPLLANGGASSRPRRGSLQEPGAAASAWRATLGDDVSTFSFAEPQAVSAFGGAEPLLKSIMGTVRIRFGCADSVNVGPRFQLIWPCIAAAVGSCLFIRGQTMEQKYGRSVVEGQADGCR